MNQKEEIVKVETTLNAKGPGARFLTWFTCFGLSVIFVAIIVLLLPRAYAEADDPGMAYLLREGYFVPFMSRTLSAGLINLYHALPQIPWYGLYQYAVLAFGFSVLLHLLSSSFIRFQMHPILRWGLFLVFTVEYCTFITQITFTYTAILMGGLGIIGYLHFLETSVDATEAAPVIAHTQWQSPLLYGCLLAMAYLTRWESIGALVFLLPVFLFVIWAAGKTGIKEIKRFVLSLVLFLLPLATIKLADHLVFPLTPAEQAYNEYALDSGNAIGFGYNRYEAHPDLLRKMGWSQTDYAMFKNWLFIDERVFSQQRIKQLLAATPIMMTRIIRELSTPAAFFQRLGWTVKHVWISHCQVSCLLLAMFFLVFSLSLTQKSVDTRKKFQPAIACLLYGGFFFIGSFLMATFMRFPSRVSFPLYYMAAFSLLLLPGVDWGRFSLFPPERNGFQQGLKIALLSAALIFASVGIGTLVNKTLKLPRLQKDYDCNANFLKSLSGRQNYVVRMPGIMNIRFTDPLAVNSLPNPDIGPGWLIYSLPYYKRLRSLGLSKASQVWPWLRNNPRGYLLVPANQGTVIQDFMQETYHLSSQMVLAGNLPCPPKAPLYQLRAVNRT